MNKVNITDFFWRRVGTTSVAELFWENSKIYPPFQNLNLDDPVIKANLAAMDRNALIIEEIVSNNGKSYDAASSIPLPYVKRLQVTLESSLENRKSVREFTKESLDIESLSTILQYGYGWSDRRVHRKYIPSAGGLYPCEIYIGAFNIEKPLRQLMLYHYQPKDHRAEELSRFKKEELAVLFTPQNCFYNAAAVIFITGVIPRLSWKYGEGSLRYILLEAGHIVQTMCLVAAARGLSSCPVVGFYDDAVHNFLDIDGISEVIIYTLFLGKEDKTNDRRDDL